MNTALILSLAAIGVAVVLFILLLVQNHKITALREALVGVHREHELLDALGDEEKLHELYVEFGISFEDAAED